MVLSMEYTVSFEKQRIVDGKIIHDCFDCKYWYNDPYKDHLNDESHCTVLKNGECPFPLRDLNKSKTVLKSVNCCYICKHGGFYDTIGNECHLHKITIKPNNKCNDFVKR
jgi:hypothetical protein